MNKQQLNKKLFELLGVELAQKQIWAHETYEGLSASDPECFPASDDYMGYNFCEDWNQLMPLAIEYGVIHGSVINGLYHATLDRKVQFKPFICTSDNPPQVAIVKCLIEFLEGE